MTADAGREPLRVAPGQQARLVVGSSPIESGQAVWVTYDVAHPSGTVDRGLLSLPWLRNEGLSSYWSGMLGPFARGDRVTYVVHGSQGEQRIDLPPVRLTVGPRLYLGLLWHQHQPAYRDLAAPAEGGMAAPWVRLHALRGYYALPALAAEFPDLRVSINLTPCLLAQLQQYTQEGVTDRALQLTTMPAERLSPQEQEELQNTFFDADWRSQIFPFPRYMELFERRREQEPFSEQDLRDLQMWYNLAWFAPQFQQGDVALPDGDTASVRRFIEREGGFSEADIDDMVAEQYKIMAAILPLHRELQNRGQIEVTTTPFYHPILPLIYDTDKATIDRPGTCKPLRFHHPADAEAQVQRAVDYYTAQFGRPPRGMWPAEGAIGPDVIPLFVRNGLEWIASDQGVLQKSGRWGYEVANPDVLCRPYQVQAEGQPLAIFFRSSDLANLIAFHYHQAFTDMEAAAEDFVERAVREVADRLSGQDDRILTIILDGENTWSAYGKEALPFFRALYRRLTASPEIETVTFSEYLHGDVAAAPQGRTVTQVNVDRGVPAHPVVDEEPLYDLFTGSWIDEHGSEPGVDLGTWIGEPDENRAWSLLRQARQDLEAAGTSPEDHATAWEALYMAEGSDWFWWLGTDHLVLNGNEFEVIFRTHLKNAYHLAGLTPPPDLDRPLVPWGIVWTFSQPDVLLGPQERLTVRTNCPGSLVWRVQPDGERQETILQAVGGPVHAVHRYEALLGPFGPEVREVSISIRCQEHLVEGAAVCAVGGETQTLRPPTPQAERRG